MPRLLPCGLAIEGRAAPRRFEDATALVPDLVPSMSVPIIGVLLPR